MTTKKTFNTPSALREEALKKNPPLLFHDDEGEVVGHINPPLLWGDEVASVAEKGTELQVMKTLLGNEYETVRAAGWTPAMVYGEFKTWRDALKGA